MREHIERVKALIENFNQYGEDVDMYITTLDIISLEKVLDLLQKFLEEDDV